MKGREPVPGTGSRMPAEPKTHNPKPDVHVSRLTSHDSPFSLEATVRLLQRRPANRIDRWVDGEYRRAVRTPEGMRLTALRNAGSIDAPDLRLELVGGPVGEETSGRIVAMVRWMLGLDADRPPAEWLAGQEPLLAPTLDRLRGFRPPAFPDLFATCLAVLPYQQLSLDAGTAIMGRLVERFGPSIRHDGENWYDFPPPEAIAEASEPDLIGVGLSRAKAVALRRLAGHALAGDLDRSRYEPLPTDAAMAELRNLPGIGPWSAAVIALRGMRRLDAFPGGDSGAARSLTGLVGSQQKLTPADAVQFAERLGNQRGYLYYLLLGSRMPWLGDPGTSTST
jgi:DNA-3-methyladenine glycosylase II